MDAVWFVDLLANVGAVLLVAIAVVSTGLFFFDSRPARKTTVLTVVHRERRAA